MSGSWSACLRGEGYGRDDPISQSETGSCLEFGRQLLRRDQPRYRRLDRALCPASRTERGERILDLATGTGWTSRAVARSGAKVVHVDIASDLLAAAKARAAAEGLDIEYRIGDAERLPFADGEFDAVISTCGVMFAGRQEAAASELGRVYHKGGRIALTTWLSDSNLFKMFQVMKPYMAPPPNPAPPSPFEWGRTERTRELLGRDFDLKFEKGVSYYREPNGEAAWTTSRPAMVRPSRWPQASTTHTERSCSAISLRSTMVFRPTSASVCRGNTG